MAEITAVTFDLWQTLLMDTQELGRARAQVRIDGAQEALNQVGLEYAGDHVREAYRACYRTCHAIREQERDVSFRQQVEIFIGHIENGLLDQIPEATVLQISTAYANSFFIYPPPPHEDAFHVLQELKGWGYAMGLISNTGMTPGTTFRAYLEQLDLIRFFDAMIFSDEIMLAKPSGEIFRRIADELHATPKGTIHIGDHLLNDVLGAKRVGMKTIWIETLDDRRAPVEVTPDITVKALGQVAAAVQLLADTDA